MAQDRYDLIVIGSGSSGSFAAREAASAYRKNVAVVEKHRWGGDCMTVACKPTKTYLTSAELYHQIRALGPELGVLADDVRLDFRQIKARKDGFVAASSGEARRRNLREHGIDLFDGVARFRDSRTIAVGEQRLQADNILLALGSLPAEPPIEGLREVGALTNETVLDLDEVPASVLVIGAGAVGVEFAQMLARFGARVTIVELAPRILPRMDSDATATLHEALAQEDIEILTASSVERLEPSDRGARAVLATPEGRRELEVARVLNAVGRRPDVDGLDAEVAGLHLDGPGLPVDAYCETDVQGIWAAGDITAVAQFTPIANYQGRLAVRNMFSAERVAADYRVLPSAVFSDPEVAAAGATEEQAREQGADVATAVAPLRSASRAGFALRPHGLAKLVYERGSGTVLGVHLVTPSASDSIQFIAVAMRLGLTIEDLARSIHVYPSFGEIVKAPPSRRYGLRSRLPPARENSEARSRMQGSLWSGTLALRKARERSARSTHRTCRMGRVVVIGVFLALVAVGCGGGDERSQAEKIRSVDEELSTLPDAGPGLGEASPPPGLRAGWETDFSKHSVSFDEFMSGGPGKDGIPAVDDPRFVAVEEADFLEDREPVIELVIDGEARAYPIQILIWHEIVNDVAGGVPVAVTFCPLCNTAIAFDRRVNEQTLDFGTTGNLRNSDLVMYDRQTESWWQQFGGEALVGELTGTKLEQLPSRIVAWADFRREHAEGKVLSQDTGFSRPYGENPYVGYDSVDSSPIFPTKNADDERLPPMERVAFIERGGEAVVVPFSILREEKAVRVEVGGSKLLVRWRPGVASSLDGAEIAAGRDIGAAEVREGGRLVTFDQPFWFAVAAFRPDARIVR